MLKREFRSPPRARRSRQGRPVRWRAIAMALGAAAVIWGCGLDAASQADGGSPQRLPLDARVTIGNCTVLLEVARTPSQQATGLMFRTQLDRDRGMAFPFEPPRSVAFWMKNTKISLDMLFLRGGVVRHIEPSVPPCTADPCPSYGPPPTEVIDLVIELAGGRAADLGIQPGDRLAIELADPVTDPAAAD